jgi:hypothetical protein
MGLIAPYKLIRSLDPLLEIPMSSQPKLPPGPVGIELLLELLNASEGLIERDASPPDLSDGAAPEVLPPVTAGAQRAEAVEVPDDIADGEPFVETIDDLENRFAAHIVRGMSKSKTR